MSTPLIPAAQLLRALGSVVRPVGAEKQPTDGISTISFDDLLAKARSGELRSDVPVTIAPGCGVELTEEQLAKVALAADRAQAQGVSRAVVAIDGMLLRLDVSVRTITGVIEPGASGVHTGIDGLITFAPEATEPALDLRGLARAGLRLAGV